MRRGGARSPGTGVTGSKLSGLGAGNTQTQVLSKNSGVFLIAEPSLRPQEVNLYEGLSSYEGILLVTLKEASLVVHAFKPRRGMV